MGKWGKGRGAANGRAGGSVGSPPGALKALAASQVVRHWKSSRASAKASSCSNSRALDLGGGGCGAEGPAAAVEQAEADRYPLSLATFWAPQPDTPERSSAPGRPSGTQHQPGITSASHYSKITWAGIPSKTIWSHQHSRETKLE